MTSDTHPAIPPGFFRDYYQQHGRWFPWRETGTPAFHILVAEMLLVQTRAGSVEKVWPRVVERWSDAHSLAMAADDELHDTIRSLGLGTRRVKSLKTAATAIVERFGGEVPVSVENLLSIPHVGLYVANAVACFAFGQQVPIVDVNMLRVFGRLTGEVYDDDNRRWPAAWEMARNIAPPGEAVEHNYGLLDFGALTCTARMPLCKHCPLAGTCRYSRKQ